MPEYRRFVAYFYEYIDGKKQKNAGFAKVELRNGTWRILFRLMVPVQPQPPVDVCGFVREGEYLLGLPMGTMRAGREMMEEWAYHAEDARWLNQYQFSDFSGIWIRSGDGRDFITVWDEESVDVGRFVTSLPQSESRQGADMEQQDMAGDVQNANMEQNMAVGVQNADMGQNMAGEVQNADIEQNMVGDVQDADMVQNVAGEVQSADMGQNTAAESQSADMKQNMTVEPQREDMKQNMAVELQNVDMGQNNAGNSQGADMKQNKAVELQSADMGQNNAGNLQGTDMKQNKAEESQSADMGQNNAGNPQIADMKQNKAEEPQSAYMKQNIAEEMQSAFIEHNIAENPQARCGVDWKPSGQSVKDWQTEQCMDIEQSEVTADEEQTTQNIGQGQLRQNMDEQNIGQSQPSQDMDEQNIRQSRQSQDMDEQNIRQSRQSQDMDGQNIGQSQPRQSMDERQSDVILQKLYRTRESFQPFEGQEIRDCIQISLNDIMTLQRANWKTGRNSFLMHGYYNYHHLLIGKKGENQHILGVPGISNPQEKYLAVMFGFPEFKAADGRWQGAASGYWCRTLEQE